MFDDAAVTLPPAWTTTAIGGANPSGSAGYVSGRFTVTAYGEDVWAAADALQYVHRTWTGDGEIVARVAALSLPAGAAFAMGGVMFRESLAPGARHATVLLGTNGKLKFRRRTTAGGTTSSDGPPAGSLAAPQWVRLTRRGNVFAGYYSADGRAWTQAGPSVTLALPSTIRVGVMALRNGSSGPTLAGFERVDVSTIPLLGADVGAVGRAGTIVRDGGATLLSGGGSDVWSTRDAFHVEYRTWTGDGDVTVHLERLTAPSGSNWAMAGIMFRESLAADSRHASLLFSTEGKLKFRRRAVPGGATASNGPSSGSTTVPRWLRLRRRGTTFTAYHSADGVRWTQVYGPVSLALPATAHVGVWVLRNGGTGRAQARFRNIIIGPPGL